MKVKSLLVLSLCFLLLASCKPKEKEVEVIPTPTPFNGIPVEAPKPPDGAEAPEPSQQRMVFVTDLTGINDGAINALIWKGLQKTSAEMEYNVDYVESHKPDDIANNLQLAADSGAKLIFSTGFMAGEELKKAAKKNPSSIFCCIGKVYSDAELKDLPNLIGIGFEEHEAAFLVGYIAGKTTESKKVGVVGDREDDETGKRIRLCFEAGAKIAQVDVTISSSFTKSGNDMEKSRELAAQFYKDGFDVVYACAGASVEGVAKAAIEADKSVIGSTCDMNALAPDNLISSSCVKADEAVLQIVRDYKSCVLQGGKNRVLGIADGAVGIAETTQLLVPSEILSQVRILEDKLKSGALRLPSTAADLDTFVAANR